MSEKKPYVKVINLGQQASVTITREEFKEFAVDTMMNLQEFIDSLSDGKTELKFEFVEMTEEEFNNLPESKGF